MKKQFFAILLTLAVLAIGFVSVYAQESDANAIVRAAQAATAQAPLQSEQSAPAENISDLDLMRTQIAATVYAEIFQTIEADGYEVVVKGQATPAPSASSIWSGYGQGYWKPTPTYYSYQARLIKQNQNYKHYAHGLQFTVQWTIKNTGPLPWNDDFYFRYVQGQPAMDNDIVRTGDVDRGETIVLTKSFEARDEPGIYNSYWELVDDDGVVILDNIWVGWQVDDWRDYE